MSSKLLILSHIDDKISAAGCFFLTKILQFRLLIRKTRSRNKPRGNHNDTGVFRNIEHAQLNDNLCNPILFNVIGEYFQIFHSLMLCDFLPKTF